MASYTAVMHEIHVLLVDHEANCLFNTAKLLETCHYRVTFVEFASAAITMLTSQKVKFDIVMANIDSPDLHGFKLLQHAVSMDLPVILMSVNENAFMTMRALENGAYLQIKKPPTIEVLKGLWQHVLREKIRKMRERGNALYAANYSSKGIELREAVHRPEENPNYGGGNNMQMTKKKGKSKKNIRERDEMDNEEEYSEENGAMNNSKIKRKVCTEWTQELHMKFLDAVHQLGEGKCFPKEILDLMNVPGLTRMQVASHLQKCRNDNWRAPGERKAQPQQATQAITSDTDPSSSNPRKFGSMPRMGMSGIQVQVPDNSGQSSRTRSETEMQHGAGQENVEREFLVTSTSHRRPLGTMAAGPSNPTRGMNSSSNTRHDEFFHFLDMDSMIRSTSGVNNPNEAPGQYRLNQVYADQNSGAPDSRSQGSSEPSNNGSDDSETRGRE